MQFIYQKFSKNYDLRPLGHQSIKYIIIHYTEVNFEESLEILCSEESKVSCHYLINKNGDLYNLVEDVYRAWHAGKSAWKNDVALNDSSIGIELVNSGHEDFASDQLEKLELLCKYLMEKYNIPRENIIGHSDIAPSRKIDPGIFFDWYEFSKKGYGIPFSKIQASTNKIKNLDSEKILKIKNGFRKIGYQVSSHNNDKEFSDVIRSFQIHFSPESIKYYNDQKYLYNIDNQYEWDEQSDLILNLITSRIFK